MPISIHATCTGSDGTASARVLVRISIHATRAGVDSWTYVNFLLVFLFTPPVRAAIVLGDVSGFNFLISIHATRMGDDGRPCPRHMDISIHTAHTGSDMIGFFPAPYPFLFTPPTWAATIARIIRDYNISIHATRTGGDFLLTTT